MVALTNELISTSQFQIGHPRFKHYLLLFFFLTVEVLPVMNISLSCSPAAVVGNPASLNKFFFFTDYLGYMHNIQVDVEFLSLGN